MLFGYIRASESFLSSTLFPKDRDHDERLWMSDRTRLFVPARYVWVTGLPNRNKIPFVMHVVGDESKTSRSMVVIGLLAVGFTFEVCRMIICFSIGGEILMTSALPHSLTAGLREQYALQKAKEVVEVMPLLPSNATSA